MISRLARPAPSIRDLGSDGTVLFCLEKLHRTAATATPSISRSATVPGLFPTDDSRDNQRGRLFLAAMPVLALADDVPPDALPRIVQETIDMEKGECVVKSADSYA